MGKRKRKRQSENREHAAQARPKPAAPFNNPFAALSGVRDELPRGESSSSQSSQEKRSPAPSPQPGSELSTCDKLVVQREKKGRSGKTVTRIAGLPPAQIDGLAKRLKSALGCGATREGDDLVLLGSLSDRVVPWLEKEGAPKVVVSGAARKGKPAKSGQVPVTAAPVQPGQRSWREPTRRGDLEAGLTVDIVLKKDQSTGALTRGVIQDILTRTATHPHGIKVRLDDGSVGRVKWIVAEAQACATR